MDRPFFEELGKVLKKDLEDHPKAYVGLIVYPVNGRAATVDPFDHYSMDREEVIGLFEAELSDDYDCTDEEIAEAMSILRSTGGNVAVRCGRIVCHILEYPRNIETNGVSVM